MEPRVQLVFVCKCGNLNCDEEALEERCRYSALPRPASTADGQAQAPTAEWEQ